MIRQPRRTRKLPLGLPTNDRLLDIPQDILSLVRAFHPVLMHLVTLWWSFLFGLCCRCLCVITSFSCNIVLVPLEVYPETRYGSVSINLGFIGFWWVDGPMLPDCQRSCWITAAGSPHLSDGDSLYKRVPSATELYGPHTFAAAIETHPAHPGTRCKVGLRRPHCKRTSEVPAHHFPLQALGAPLYCSRLFQ